MDVLHSPGFWGLLGAFVYAAPKWVICRRGGCGGLCHIEFSVSVLVGCVIAAGFAPALASLWNRPHDEDVRAISTMLGILANPVTPSVVKVLGDVIVKRLAKGDPNGA